MADITFKVDTSQLTALQGALLTLSGKMNRVTAVAMTRSAKAAQAELRRRTPDYIDRPTPWTLNGTFVRPASEAKLVTTVGFKDDTIGISTPAAKYLQLQVSGGRAKHKPFEKLLQRRGILRSGEFAIPSGAAPFTFNSYGNIPSSKYVQMLSRLNALREAGSTSNRTGSPRSRAARRKEDFFVAEINGHRAIWARVGQDKRGIRPVFHFVNAPPKFGPRFPVPSIVTKTFHKAFPGELIRAVDEQIRYNRRLR